MNVTVLALERCTSIAPIGAAELLRKSSVLHSERTGSDVPVFDVEVVSATKRELAFAEGYSILCARTLAEISATDLLLIPAIDFDIRDKLALFDSCPSELTRLHAQGTEIGSMCTGAFLLAASGLLDGRRATTHWAMAGLFRQMYPAVRLEDERILIDNGSLYCAGGATAFMNLVIYLVEKYCGKETAIAASQMFLIDYVKPAQSLYAVFSPTLNHGDEMVALAQREILEHAKLWTVDELAERTHVSRKTFTRRFKNATGHTPSGFIRRAAVERAKRMLETENVTFEEIARRVGYEDVGSLRSAFRTMTSLTPSGYRNRYRHPHR